MKARKATLFSHRGISVRTAAECKGVSCHTIYNWIAAGKISARKVNGRYVIKEDEKFAQAARYRRLPKSKIVQQNRKLRRENRQLQRDLAAQRLLSSPQNLQLTTSPNNTDQLSAPSPEFAEQIAQLQSQHHEEIAQLRENFAMQYQKLQEESALYQERLAQENSQLRHQLDAKTVHNEQLHQEITIQRHFNEDLQNKLRASDKFCKDLCYQYDDALERIEYLEEELAKWHIVDVLEKSPEVVVELLQGCQSQNHDNKPFVIDALSHWEVTGGDK